MRFVLSLLLVAMVVGCTVPMYRPVGLGIPKYISDESIMSAVKSGVVRAGWRVVETETLRVVGSFSQGEKSARVRIEYDPSIQVVSFTHLDSSNMNYVKGTYKDRIDFSYNVKLLAMEKAVALNLAQLVVSNPN